MAIDRAPLAGRVLPSRANSPTTAYCASSSDSICPLPTRMPSAIGRSNDAASLGRSAGARLITTRLPGFWKPELTIARSTRCVLSLTAASGKSDQHASSAARSARRRPRPQRARPRFPAARRSSAWRAFKPLTYHAQRESDRRRLPAGTQSASTQGAIRNLVQIARKGPVYVHRASIPHCHYVAGEKQHDPNTAQKYSSCSLGHKRLLTNLVQAESRITTRSLPLCPLLWRGRAAPQDLGAKKWPEPRRVGQAPRA